MNEEVNSEVSVEMIFSDGLYTNPEEFSIFIEKTVVRTGERYLDTIMDYCNEHNIEPLSLSKSMTSSLKEKLQAECERFNLLHTKSGRLPE